MFSRSSLATSFEKFSEKMAVPSNRCAWPDMFAAAMLGRQHVDVASSKIDAYSHCRADLVEGGFTVREYTQTLPIAGLLRTQQRSVISWSNTGSNDK